MKKILLLTTCLLGGLVAADTSGLPTDPDQNRYVPSMPLSGKDQTTDRFIENVILYASSLYASCNRSDFDRHFSTLKNTFASKNLVKLDFYADTQHAPVSLSDTPYSDLFKTDAYLDYFKDFWDHLIHDRLIYRVNYKLTDPNPDYTWYVFEQTGMDQTLILRAYLSRSTSLPNQIVDLIGHYHAEPVTYSQRSERCRIQHARKMDAIKKAEEKERKNQK